MAETVQGLPEEKWNTSLYKEKSVAENLRRVKHLG